MVIYAIFRSFCHAKGLILSNLFFSIRVKIIIAIIHVKEKVKEEKNLKETKNVYLKQ